MKKKKTIKIPKPKSEGEEMLALHLRAAGIIFEREYVFHPTRKWRFDFAIMRDGVKLAVEVEGGLFMRHSGHNTAKGIMRDMEKANAASSLGWVLMRFTPAQVRKLEALDAIRAFLGREGA